MKRSVSMIAMLVIAAAVAIPAIAAEQAKSVKVSATTQTNPVYITDATRRICAGERGKSYWNASPEVRKNRDALHRQTCREVGLPSGPPIRPSA